MFVIAWQTKSNIRECLRASGIQKKWDIIECIYEQHGFFYWRAGICGIDLQWFVIPRRKLYQKLISDRQALRKDEVWKERDAVAVYENAVPGYLLSSWYDISDRGGGEGIWAILSISPTKFVTEGFRSLNAWRIHSASRGNRRNDLGQGGPKQTMSCDKVQNSTESTRPNILFMFERKAGRSTALVHFDIYESAFQLGSGGTAQAKVWIWFGQTMFWVVVMACFRPTWPYIVGQFGGD